VRKVALRRRPVRQKTLQSRGGLHDLYFFSKNGLLREADIEDAITTEY